MAVLRSGCKRAIGDLLLPAQYETAGNCNLFGANAGLGAETAGMIDNPCRQVQAKLTVPGIRLAR